jgi:hypothetical protein
MMISAELELIGLIYALYLQDSVLLLHSNEGVITSTGEGRWSLGLGSTHARIMGKNLLFPNPLMVHRPQYRMGWSFEEVPAKVALPHKNKKAKKGTKPNSDAGIAYWAPDLQAFKLLSKFTIMNGLLQLVLLPLIIMLYQTDALVISAIAVTYLMVFATLGVARANAELFGLTGRKFVGLCFECLVCPPLAINLVRRLSLDLCSSADLLDASAKLLAPEDWANAKQKFAQRLEDQMSALPLDSVEFAGMQSRLEHLLGREKND